MLGRFGELVGAFMLALLLVVALGLGTLSVANFGQQQHVACQQVNVLRNAIVQILTAAERSAPASPYFKHNPALLRAAEQNYAQDISKLGPISC